MTKQPLPGFIARFDYPATTPEERLRSLAGAGVHTILVGWPNNTPYCFGWDGRDRYDYRPLDAQLDALAEIDPEVRFLLNFGSLHGAPYYWGVDHQDELGQFHLGLRMQSPSLASELWLRESGEAARRFAAHFREGPHGERLVGFVPFSVGVDWHGVGESFVEIPDKETPAKVDHPKEGDFSAPMLRAYRAFLREKYGSDAALQAAWRDTAATLDGAPLPSRVDVRSPLPRVADYFECYNRLNARQAIAWCEALKQGAPDRLVGLSHGFVYGYPNREAIHPQGCGHNAPEELLASPAIDFFVSEPSGDYGDGNPLSQHALGSIRLAGKRHAHVFAGANLQLVPEAKQIAGLTLAAGYAAAQGSFLALGELRYGPLSPSGAHEQFAVLPYDSDALRRAIRALHALPPAGSPAADVATFVSPRASYGRAMEKGFGARIERFRNEVLLRSGLCFDEYLLSDFGKVAACYRFWVFLDCPDLSAEDWKSISAEPGRCCFATGSRPPADATELREAARVAGAHVWCETGDTLFASENMVVVAARTGGEKTVVLPASRPVVDAVTGESFGGSARTFSFTLAAGETRIFTLG